MSTAPLAGQDDMRPAASWRPHQVTITALGGGAAYSSFLNVDVAADADERLTARTSLAVAGALGYWPSHSLGIRLHGGWAPTRFERERRGGGSDGNADARGADLSIWMANLDVLIRLPLALGRVEPYGVAGGGVVHYAAAVGESVPLEARADFAGGSRTRAALVLGGGVLVPMQRNNLLLTFELTDHIVRSPVTGPGGAAEGITSNVRLLVGITLPLAWAGP